MMAQKLTTIDGMNRKEFVESHSATCKNWRWAWSYVNHAERFVIFGAWDKETDGDKALILRDSWVTNKKGHRNAAYKRSLEHVMLVRHNNYELRTFPIEHSDELMDDEAARPRSNRSSQS